MTTRLLLLLIIGLMLLATACSAAQAPQVAGVNPVPVQRATTTLPATATPMPPMATPTPSTATPAIPQGMVKAYAGIFKDNTVAVIDTGTNRVLRTIPIPAGPHGLVMTPNGEYVYASSDGDTKVSVIDTASDTMEKTIEVGKAPHGLAITPDGKLVLVAVFGTDQVAMIDTASNTVIAQIPVPNPHNIAISPDGKTAYVAAQKPQETGLVILNIAERKRSGVLPLDKTPRALNFSPDGKQLYFTLAGVDAVQVLDPEQNKMIAQIPVGASPHHPLFTPDGKLGLVVSQGPGTLSILNPATETVSSTVMVGKQPHWIAVNSAGTVAYVTNEGSNTISVVDLATSKVTATIPVGNAPRKIVMQPAQTAMKAADMQAAIKGFAFPATITVHAGQSIVWTNDDAVPHTVTETNGQWDSGDIAPGATFRLTLDKPGTYTYYCMHHPFMKGTIIVTEK